MYEQLEIEIQEQRGPITVIALKGRLDASGAQQLREQCSQLRKQSHKQVVVSLADVTFVASSGFGTFLLLTEEFQKDGGKIVFTEISKSIMRVIELLNLDKFLALEDSVAKARDLVGV